jgi:flagellar basal-body rod modification protein FlgD
MSINAIEPAGSVSRSNRETSGTAVMGKDDFLNLLVAQLQHQDPLSPMESTDFTAQLAQFTSLEQLSNINGNLEQLQQYQAAVQNSQAVGLIGKTVEAAGNSVSVAQDRPAALHFELAENAAYLAANIYGPAGNFVGMVEAGGLSAGRHELSWDGRDLQGNTVPEGTYTFEVLAVGSGGETVAAVPYVSARVTGVSFGDHSPQVLADGQSISVGLIRRVSEEPQGSSE